MAEVADPYPVIGFFGWHCDVDIQESNAWNFHMEHRTNKMDLGSNGSELSDHSMHLIPCKFWNDE